MSRPLLFAVLGLAAVLAARVAVADAVELSGETTVGAYPLECVKVLKKIIESLESMVGDPFNSCIEF